MSLLLASLLAALGTACCQKDGVTAINPTNVVVKPSARSLEVLWDVPTQQLQYLDSYRLRIYPTNDYPRRRVYWMPVAEDKLRQIITGLEPNTRYEVLVSSRFHRDNVTHDYSSSVSVATKSEPGFLSRVWEQKVYVLIGAILMVLVALFFVPCICCCYFGSSKRRNSRLVDIEDMNFKNETAMTSKETYLPSASELQRRETQSRMHSRTLPSGRSKIRKDSAEGFDACTSSRFQSSSSQFADMPPPSYSHTTLRSMASAPVLQAGCERPPMPVPRLDESEADLDNDYQNDVFLPPPPQPEANLYGNVQIY